MLTLHKLAQQSVAGGQSGLRKRNGLDLRAWRATKSRLVKDVSKLLPNLTSVRADDMGVVATFQRSVFHLPLTHLAQELWSILCVAVYSGYREVHGRWSNVPSMNGLLFLVECNEQADCVRLSVGLQPCALEVLQAFANRRSEPTPMFMKALGGKARLHQQPFPRPGSAEAARLWRSEVEGFKRFFAPRLRLKPAVPGLPCKTT